MTGELILGSEAGAFILALKLRVGNCQSEDSLVNQMANEVCKAIKLQLFLNAFESLPENPNRLTAFNKEVEQ